MRRYISLSLLLFIGLISYVQPVHATTYSPIVIEPYDKESLSIIGSSLGSLKSHIDRVKEDRATLINAIQLKKANPTPENAANVTEKAGQMLYTTVEFANNTQTSVSRIIPELHKYKKYLLKISASMGDKDDPLISESLKQMQTETKRMDNLLNYLKEVEDDLKTLKKDLAMLTSAWFHNEQMQQQLRKIFGVVKFENIQKEFAGVLDTLSDVKEIITGLINDNNMGCTDEEFAAGTEQYRASKRNYYRVGRR